MNYHNTLLVQFIKLVDDPWVIAFIWSVLMDIGTGLMKSWISKGSQSTKGLRGLITHSAVIMIVMSVYPFLITVNFGMYANTLIVFFIITYAISITENLGQMGIEIPEVIKNHLLKLQDDYNHKGGNNDTKHN